MFLDIVGSWPTTDLFKGKEGIWVLLTWLQAFGLKLIHNNMLLAETEDNRLLTRQKSERLKCLSSGSEGTTATGEMQNYFHWNPAPLPSQSFVTDILKQGLHTLSLDALQLNKHLVL